MIERKQIESILKINGITSSSSDDEIKSVLLSASYNNDEIDEAIAVIRQDIATNHTRIDGLHKVFRTDAVLQPQEVSNLLGVEIDIEKSNVLPAKTRIVTKDNYLRIAFMAFALAVTAIIFFMFLNKVGLFHPGSNCKECVEKY